MFKRSMMNEEIKMIVDNALKEYWNLKRCIQTNEMIHEIATSFPDVEILKYHNVHYLFIGMLDCINRKVAVICTLQSSDICTLESSDKFPKPGLHAIPFEHDNPFESCETMPYMMAVSIVRESVSRFKIESLFHEEMSKVAKKSELYLSCLF